MKGLKFTTKFLIVFALFVCFGQSDTLAVSRSLSFSAADLTFGQERGFQRLSLAGCGLMGEIGKPQLPVKYLRLIIPQDMDVDSVVISNQASVQVQGSYYIFPAQHPVYDFQPVTYPFVEPDSIIYNSSEPFPEKLAQPVRHDFFDGCNRISTIAVYPVQYQPAESTLTLYTAFSLELSFKPATGRAIQPRLRAAHLQRTYDRFLRYMVDNSEDIPAYGCGPQILGKGGGGGIPEPEEPPFYEYVIVTHDSLKNYFDTYKSWMYRKGLDCGVVTLSEIYDFYVKGDTIGATSIIDNPGSIRTYLCNAWANGAVYALLAGVAKGVFPSPAIDVVPVRVGAYDEDPSPFTPTDSATYWKWIPTDLYYSEFNGDWEEDDDGNYGEPEPEDGVEYAPEIFVGRLPCVSGQDIMNWTEKVLQYEIIPGDSDFTYLTRHLCGQADKGETNNECLDVRTRFIAQGWTTSTLTGSDSPTGSEYIDSMSSGYAFVDWHHHGEPHAAYVSGAPKAMVTTYDAYPDTIAETGNGLDNLANDGQYSVLYAVNCKLAAYDIAHYTEKLSVAEGFSLFEKRGGPCFLANTRRGYPAFSIDLERMFLDTLFSAELTLSQAEAYSKWEYSPYSMGHELAFSHNLIGDPQLYAWCTPCPDGIQEFDVTYFYGSELVIVNDKVGNPVQGAWVCLSNDATNEWDTSRTDQDGHAFFQPSDIDTNDVIVVTKPNFLPSIRRMGHIENNATWNGWVVVSGDITIDQGAKLTIKPGTRVLFEAYDEMSSGEFTDKPEIRVLGTLVAKGTLQDSIFFGLRWKTNPSGSWGGISVGPTGVASIKYAEIKDAYTGVCLGVNSTDTISYCKFQDNYYAAVIDSSDNADIAGNRIDRDPGLNLEAEYGIYIHGVNTGSNASLQSNIIKHYKRGIRAVDCATKFKYNKISGDSCGIHVSGSSQVNIEESELYGQFADSYIRCDTSEINLFRNKLWGNAETKYGVVYDSSMGGIARENKIKDFETGIHCRFGGPPPDWGKDSTECEGTPGYNWFELITSGFYITNNDTDDTLYAQLNWWGTANPASNRFVGKVKYLPCLEEPPDWIPQKIVSSQPQKSFQLFQNYPNPFNAVTEIRYALPSECKVKLVIYNILGRKVRTLVNEQQSTGLISVRWDGRDDKGSDVSTGIYLYKLQAGEFTETKKMLFLK